MSQLKELLIDQLQDLLHAETQLTNALPKMAGASNHPRLREAFEKHLVQTEGQLERLKHAFSLLGEEATPKPCKAMMGLVAEGEETIKEGQAKDPLSADLALIAAAQRVEHYEISAYGTAKSLARQMGATEVARLLSHTLGEEQAADYLLTAIADPIVQQVSLNDLDADVDLETVGVGSGDKAASARRKKASRN